MPDATRPPEHDADVRSLPTLRRPETLEHFLDRGGDLGACEFAHSFYDWLGDLHRTTDDRLEQARLYQQMAEAWLSGHVTVAETMMTGEPPKRTQYDITRMLWHAELLGNPALDDRFRAAVPEETLRARQEFDAMMEDQHQRRYRLQPGPTGPKCWACGENPRSLAVTVVDRWEENDDIVLCLSCLTPAIRAARALNNRWAARS